MARNKFTPEQAREAGRRSRRKPVNNKDFIEYMKGDGAKKAAEELRRLSGRQYIDAFFKLAPFVWPRLQSIDIDAELHGKVSIAPHEWVETNDSQ